MSELFKGKKDGWDAVEQMRLVEKMERMRMEIQERRRRRVRLIQSLHC